MRLDLRFGLLLTVFFVSGFSGLVYEVVWTRRFTLLFGTSELATAAVLAAYLGGLGAGAGRERVAGRAEGAGVGAAPASVTAAAAPEVRRVGLVQPPRRRAHVRP